MSVPPAANDDPGRDAFIYDPATVDWAVAEVVARPPPRISRVSLYLSFAIIFGLLAFAWVTTVPTIVSSRGWIRSSEKARPVSTEVSGRIATLRVQQGARVKQGDVLVEMGQLLSKEDAAHAEEWVRTARSLIKAPESKALLTDLDGFMNAGELSGHYLAQESEAVVTTAKAFDRAVQFEVQTLPNLLAGPSVERAQLQAKISKIEALKDEREFAVDLDQLRTQVANLSGQLVQKRADAATQVASTRAAFETAVDVYARAARAQAETQQVVAPMDGTVLEVIAAGRGELVSQGQKLLTIVPDLGELIATVELSNKDIPGVREGMPVRLKLDALPASDWGVLQGTVRTVAKDARVAEGGKEPTYGVTVALNATQLHNAAGAVEPVRLGMELTAEIKTREQSLLRLFLLDVLKLRSFVS